MKVQEVFVKQRISGVPIVGRKKVFEALDLYAANPPPVSRFSRYCTPTSSDKNPRIIRSDKNNFSQITSKEVFLHRLKALLQEKFDKERKVYEYFKEAIEPFDGMQLIVTVIDREKELYLLELTRSSNASFEERLAGIHNVECGLASVTVSIPFIREGDEIRIDFEKLIRLFDNVIELNTKDIKGSDVLEKITSFGRRKENKFSLHSYSFEGANNFQANMSFYSIAEGYDFSENEKAGVCVIDGSVLVAPLDKRDSPKMEIKISGKIPGSDYLDVPVVDKEKKEKALVMADQIAAAFKTLIPKIETLPPRRSWWQFDYLTSLFSSSSSGTA